MNERSSSPKESSILKKKISGSGYKAEIVDLKSEPVQAKANQKEEPRMIKLGSHDTSRLNQILDNSSLDKMSNRFKTQKSILRQSVDSKTSSKLNLPVAKPSSKLPMSPQKQEEYKPQRGPSPNTTLLQRKRSADMVPFLRHSVGSNPNIFHKRTKTSHQTNLIEVREGANEESILRPVQIKEKKGGLRSIRQSGTCLLMVSKSDKNFLDRTFSSKQSLDDLKHHDEQPVNQEQIEQALAEIKEEVKKGFHSIRQSFEEMRSASPPPWSNIVHPTIDHEKLRAFRFVSVLGEGSFSKVWYVRQLTPDARRAIKIFDKFKHSPKVQKNVNNEIAILQRLNHKNIMKLYDHFDSKRNKYMVLEYCGSKSLASLLDSTDHKTVFPESEAALIFFQLAQTLKHLHESHIYHRDIKLDNILYNSEGVMKLIDFGFAIHLKNLKLVAPICGTPIYVSPEIANHLFYLPDKADVWAFGICLYRVLSGKFPFHGSTQTNLYYSIKKGQYDIPAALSDEAKDLLKNCLTLDSKTRPSMDWVIKHKFFRFQNN